MNLSTIRLFPHGEELIRLTSRKTLSLTGYVNIKKTERTFCFKIGRKVTIVNRISHTYFFAVNALVKYYTNRPDIYTIINFRCPIIWTSETLRW